MRIVNLFSESGCDPQSPIYYFYRIPVIRYTQIQFRNSITENIQYGLPVEMKIIPCNLINKNKCKCHKQKMQFNRNSKCNNEVYNSIKEIPCNAEKETTHLYVLTHGITSRWIYARLSNPLIPCEVV
jgi:hypothetical protein